MRWTGTMKALLGFVATAVVIVVFVGGLAFSFSGPSPLTTKVVNFEPRSATSVIDRCAQANGLVRVSGSTTATASVSPTLSVFALDSADNPMPVQRTVDLSALHPGESASWKVAFRDRQAATGCGVATLITSRLSPTGS
jgi:hypothetical protein